MALLCVVGALVYSDAGRAPDGRLATAPQQDSLPPAGWTVKGNISVNTGERLYHIPGMRDYATTVIDTSRGERWFRTEADAVAAGWRRADARRAP